MSHYTKNKVLIGSYGLTCIIRSNNVVILSFGECFWCRQEGIQYCGSVYFSSFFSSSFQKFCLRWILYIIFYKSLNESIPKTKGDEDKTPAWRSRFAACDSGAGLAPSQRGGRGGSAGCQARGLGRGGGSGRAGRPGPEGSGPATARSDPRGPHLLPGPRAPTPTRRGVILRHTTLESNNNQKGF